MNATKWPSLTEFAKYLGQESICRVEETEKGIHISWIDNSPDALRRKEALRKKEAQDQGDEQLEQRIIKEQIWRAQQADSTRRNPDADENGQKGGELKRSDGEKIKLSFGSAKSKTDDTDSASSSVQQTPGLETATQPAPAESHRLGEATELSAKPDGLGGLTMKMSGKPQTKNVFAQAKKKASAEGSKKKAVVDPPKKMSEAERIMKEEMERKRPRETAGFSAFPDKRRRG